MTPPPPPPIPLVRSLQRSISVQLQRIEELEGELARCRFQLELAYGERLRLLKQLREAREAMGAEA